MAEVARSQEMQRKFRSKTCQELAPWYLTLVSRSNALSRPVVRVASQAAEGGLRGDTDENR